MKKITERRIAAPLLSILNFIVQPAFIFLSTLIIAIIFPSLKTTPDGLFENDLPTIAAKLFGSAFAVLVSYAVVKSFSKVSIKEALSFRDFDFSVPVMLTLFAWSAAELSGHFVGILLSNFMTLEPNRSMELSLNGIVSAVIIAPIAEEIIYRFTVCELSREIYSLPIICIADGIIFAFCHGYNIQGFVNVFIGGVCAAYIYCKTRNILYTILEHALHNAVCFLPFGDITSFEKNGFVLCKWWYLLINVLIIAGCIVWYIKVFRKKHTDFYFKVGITENKEAVS